MCAHVTLFVSHYHVTQRSLRISVKAAFTRIRIFWISGFGFRPRVSGVSSRRIRHFWILSPEWRFFNPVCISKRVNRSTSSLPWILNIQDGPSKEKIADSKISGYVWTGKFVLYPDTCGRGNFCVRKEKVECSKISGCLWMASKKDNKKRVTKNKQTNKQWHA